MESGTTSRGDDGNALLEYLSFKGGAYHSNERPLPDDPPSCPSNPPPPPPPIAPASTPPFEFSVHCKCYNCMTTRGYAGHYKRRL